MHYAAVCLVSAGEEVESLLAPYDENLQLEEPVEVPCWYCQDFHWKSYTEARESKRGREITAETEKLVKAARENANAVAEVVPLEEFETIWHTARAAAKRSSLPEIKRLAEEEERLEARFEELQAEEAALWDETEKRLRREMKPDPDCGECKGTGKAMTNSNLDGHWDWWQPGGRWTGFFDPDYHPSTDERNLKPCDLCGQTGKRYWSPAGRPTTADDPEAEERTCNGCEGTGTAVEWPTNFASYEGDVISAREWLEKINGDGEEGRFIPYAVVNAEGWNEKDDRRPYGEWVAEVQRLAEEGARRGKAAVIVDVHS